MSRLRELIAAKTPGEWDIDGCGDIFTDADVRFKKLINMRDGEGEIGTTAYYTEGNPNAQLIVTLVNAAEEIADFMDAYKDFINVRTDTGWLHLNTTLEALDKKLGGEDE